MPNFWHWLSLDNLNYPSDKSLTMNKLILMSLALAMPAFAGTSSTVQTTYEPAPAQQEWQWFVGASATYLFDYEEVLYTGNVGVKSPWSPMGFATSFYLESGFMEQDNDGAANLGLGINGNAGVDIDLKVVPITANVKFEKAFTDQFGYYFGAGIGSARTELSSVGIESYDEWVLTAQVFTGVNYRVNDHAEIYTGARWVYFDDADNYQLDDDFGAELGFRWHF
jgi:opacity protein-like surface antigen